MDRRHPHLPTERATLHIQTGVSSTTQQQHLSTDSTSSCDSLMTQIPHPFHSPQDHQQAYSFVPHSEPYTTPTIIQDPTMQPFPPNQQLSTPSLNPTSAAYVPNSYQQSFGSTSSFPSQNTDSLGNFSRNGSIGSATSYQPSQFGLDFQKNGMWAPNGSQAAYHVGNYQSEGYQENTYQGNNYPVGAIQNNYSNYTSQGGVAGTLQFDEFGIPIGGYGALQGEHGNQHYNIQHYPPNFASQDMSYGTSSVMSSVNDQPRAYSYNLAPNSQVNDMYGDFRPDNHFSMISSNHLDQDGRYEVFKGSAASQEQTRAPFPYSSHPNYINPERIGANSSGRSASSVSNFSTDRVKAYAKEFGKGKGKNRKKKKLGHSFAKSGQQGGISGSIATLNETLNKLKLESSNLGGPVQNSGHNAQYTESSNGSTFDTRSEVSEIKDDALVSVLVKNGKVRYSSASLLNFDTLTSSHTH